VFIAVAGCSAENYSLPDGSVIISTQIAGVSDTL